MMSCQTLDVLSLSTIYQVGVQKTACKAATLVDPANIGVNKDVID